MTRAEMLWEKFKMTGSVEDYLAFKQQQKKETADDLQHQGPDNQGTIHG